MAQESQRRALIIGASRGLGLGLVKELLARDWTVTGTVRGNRQTPLHEFAATGAQRLSIETLDMTDAQQLEDLRQRLDGQSLDLLFVNGGITRGDVPTEQVEPETFAEVMLTNALAPIRTIDALQDLVPAEGTLGIMSSSQGSISLNDRGGQEVYRASKSALNQLVRSYAARHRDDPRTLLLINPGWVQTDLGGSHAMLTLEQSIPGVLDTITAHQGEGGLHFVDYQNQTVAW